MQDDFQQTVDLRKKNKKTDLEEIYSGHETGNRDLRKISMPEQNPRREKIIKITVFILAFLIVVFIARVLFFSNKNFGKSDETRNWYSVKLVNGEIFYGQISDVKADPVVMSNVYYNYDQSKNKDGLSQTGETGNLRLVKRGKETHGPDGTMDIVRSQVLFMEQLKDDSKVLKAILDYEK